MRQYQFKVGDVVLHSTKSGVWIVDHIAPNGALMLKQIATAEGKKKIGRNAIYGGPRCRPAQELINDLQFIINKYSGTNG